MKKLSKISLREAEEIVLDTFQGDKLVSSIDFKDMYVFSILPKGYDEDKSGIYVKTPVAVYKDSGKIAGFNPLMHDASEYKIATQTTIKFY